MTSGVPALAAGFASKFDEIGPYIGFGSLVAVVAMAILVFAQGRELQRLREWAGSSPERLDALEQEVRDGQAQRLAQPAPRPGYAVPGAAAGAVAGQPRPAGTPGAPGGPPLPGTPPAPPGAPGVASPPGTPVVGAGATAAPGAPGAARPTPPRPTPPGAAPPTRVLGAASSGLGGPRAATAAGAAAATARERERDGSGPQRSIGQIIGVSVVGLVVLLALLFAFGVIGGGSDAPQETGPNADATTPTTTNERPATPRYDRKEMNTVVYNASGTALLAKDVSDRIEEEFRFPMGQAANYNTIPGGTDTAATTTIQYRTGADQSVSQNRAAAQAVARFLKLKTNGTVVRRMTSIVSAGSAGQKIVVVVGADYARANPNAGAGQSGSAGATTNPATPPASGATGGATGTTTTEQAAPSGQLANPSTTDLGTTDPGVDGTGGAGVP